MRDKAVLYQCHKLIFEEGESLIFNHWRTDCRRWNKSLPKSSALFYINDANHQINVMTINFQCSFCLFPARRKPRLNFPQTVNNQDGLLSRCPTAFRPKGKFPWRWGNTIEGATCVVEPFAKMNPSLKGQIFHGKRLNKKTWTRCHSRYVFATNNISS